MREDPFLITYHSWVRRLNPNTTRHHCIPRSRPALFGQVRFDQPVLADNGKWNILLKPPVEHQLWHKMFNWWAPWEVTALLSQEVIFESWDVWLAFGWLIVFGQLTPGQSARVLSRSDGFFQAACLEIVSPAVAQEIVIAQWTPPLIQDFTAQAAGICV